MQRLQSMPAQEALQLEREKQIAKQIYLEQEMQRTAESGVTFQQKKTEG